MIIISRFVNNNRYIFLIINITENNNNCQIVDNIKSARYKHEALAFPVIVYLIISGTKEGRKGGSKQTALIDG